MRSGLVSLLVLFLLNLNNGISIANTSACFLLEPIGGNYTVTIVKDSQKTIPTFGTSLNNQGQITGYRIIKDKYESFLWSKEDGLEELSWIPENTASVLYGINNNGSVVGSIYPDPYSLGLLFYTQHPDKPPPDQQDLFMGGSDINNEGMVAGVYKYSDSFYMRPFIKPKNSDPTLLESDIKDNFYVRAINHSGTFVGAAGGKAYKWSKDEEKKDLDTIEGDGACMANDINMYDQIVGWSRKFNDGGLSTDRAVIWDENCKIMELPNLGGESRAYSVNDEGIIAGSAKINKNKPWQAVIWWKNQTGGYAIEILNKLVSDNSLPRMNYELQIAKGINENGKIVCNGILKRNR